MFDCDFSEIETFFHINITTPYGGKDMDKELNVRWGWLKGMYIYSIIGAGGFGLGIIIMPEIMRSVIGWPIQNPNTLGICGSVFIAFALLSILGLRAPLKFTPILLLSLCYKSIWFIGVFFPLLFAGKFPNYAIPCAIMFATYIIGNLIAIPFPSIFAGQSDQ